MCVLSCASRRFRLVLCLLGKSTTMQHYLGFEVLPAFSKSTTLEKECYDRRLAFAVFVCEMSMSRCFWFLILTNASVDSQLLRGEKRSRFRKTHSPLYDD